MQVLRTGGEVGMIFNQPKHCSECFYIRCYNDYMVCTNPSFPKEMGALDISSFQVNPDAIPDWCPYILTNKAFSLMPKEKQDAIKDICNGFSVLFDWDKTSKEEQNNACD